MSEAFDRETGELLPITSSATRSLGHLHPISALPASTEAGEVWGAMILAMQDMRQPRKTKTANIVGREGRQGFSYKYAPIEEITKVLKPALKPQGLWYQQGLVYRGHQQAFVRTMVIHKSGQWTACDYPVFADPDARRFAGGVTMACRRGLMLMFGITPEDDNEEIHEDTPARIREPRTQPRKSSAETTSAQVVEDGWKAADKGVASLQAFAEERGLTPSVMTGEIYKRQLAYAEKLDRERAGT